MYWIFFVLFAFGVLVPDIIRGNVGFLSEERAEEVVIFLLGAIGFLIFIFKEKELLFEKREKERNIKRLDETGKDLIESYSYIGEVNRKMDLLMGIVLGISEEDMLDKKKEKESYQSIVNAARLLFKGENAVLSFFDEKEKRPEVNINVAGNHSEIRRKDLEGLGESVNVYKTDDFLVVCSPNKINGIRSCIKVEDYVQEEEKKPKNMEILKVLASQALFIYSFVKKGKVLDKI